MISNKDMPAMPQSFAMNNDECGTAGTHLLDGEYYEGLTKREMFAMHAMAAWIQHHGSANNYSFSAKDAALTAIQCADALLAKLEKKDD